jgi:hypothetical protein
VKLSVDSSITESSLIATTLPFDWDVFFMASSIEEIFLLSRMPMISLASSSVSTFCSTSELGDDLKTLSSPDIIFFFGLHVLDSLSY